MAKISDAELMAPEHISGAIQRAYDEGRADVKLEGVWEDSVAKIWSESYSRIAVNTQR